MVPPIARTTLVALLLAGLSAVATPARGELVFFASGRSLSVKGHRVEGDSLVLALRSGGEVICELSVITRIEPDEVPYPEPEAAVLPAPLPALVSVSAPVPWVPYADIIDSVAAEHGVPARLVKAVIQVESAYHERARSRKGAMGLMQLMPATARFYAVADPYEPRSNIEAGIKYLKSLLDRFDTPLALAAYNAGEVAVRRFGGVPPYPETRDYVSRVLNLAGR